MRRADDRWVNGNGERFDSLVEVVWRWRNPARIIVTLYQCYREHDHFNTRRDWYQYAREISLIYSPDK